MSDTTKPYTADQLEAGIANALAAHDMQAAVDILTVLAGVDGLRAYDVLKVIEAGSIIAARASRTPTGDDAAQTNAKRGNDE